MHSDGFLRKEVQRDCLIHTEGCSTSDSGRPVISVIVVMRALCRSKAEARGQARQDPIGSYEALITPWSGEAGMTPGLRCAIVLLTPLNELPFQAVIRHNCRPRTINAEANKTTSPLESPLMVTRRIVSLIYNYAAAYMWRCESRARCSLLI